MSGLAGHTNRSTVHFYDGFGDSQAHARALNGHSLGAAAIKLFEDHGLIEVVDSRPMVGHTDHELRFANLGGD